MIKVDQLTEEDIYSLLLFTLYKVTDIPEQSTLSELVYILDKKSFVKLCQYFGGMTITIPTIQDLETLVQALTLYVKVNIEKKPRKAAVEELDLAPDVGARIVKLYNQVEKVMDKYDFVHRETE